MHLHLPIFPNSASFQDLTIQQGFISDSFFFRSRFEKIQRSKKVAEEFIASSMPDHYIKSVSADGYCIIHAVVEALTAVGRPVKFHTVSSSLRTELQKQKYQETWVPSEPLFLDLIHAFDEFMDNPLGNYDRDITDLSLRHWR